MGVVSIGSPIGKVAIDKPWPEHFDRFKKAVESGLLRGRSSSGFSAITRPGGEGKGPLDPHRDEVVDRFRQKCEYLKDVPVTLVHENEKGIFGDVGRRCAELMKGVDSPKLRPRVRFRQLRSGARGPGRKLAVAQAVHVHIHIKDAKKGTAVVPAGEGDGRIPQILKDAWDGGYRGFVTLEPHLKVAGHSHGETTGERGEVEPDHRTRRARRPLTRPARAVHHNHVATRSGQFHSSEASRPSTG